MNEKFQSINLILNEIKSKIEAHNKFKKEYNRQLALDFNLFQFFKVGENKVSELLAYFLNINESHGQGDLFLKEFLNNILGQDFNLSTQKIICEKIISNKRRIDIYIELPELTIAIENKIWADDQNDQIKDYSNYLEKQTFGKYKLLYLTPYSIDPSEKSIDETLKEDLIQQKKLKIIGYKQDIIPLINNWIAKCEADNVSYFLKELKKYLEIKFLGKNTLNMSKELRNIIFENEREIEEIVNEYKQIEKDQVVQLDSIANDLNESTPDIEPQFKIEKIGPFNYQGGRYYKYSVSKENDKIWIQINARGIHIHFSYYLQGESDKILDEILKKNGIFDNKKIGNNETKKDIVDMFLDQVKIACKSLLEIEN